jgi:GDP-4-dehydro-6-deoxy-D-mannose reductase
MQKFLIMVFSGFVSRYFLWYLELSGMKSEILGIDISEPDFEISDSEIIKIRFSKIDLLDREKLQHLIFSFHPQYVLHLASFSSVGFSWKNPPLSFSNNMNIYLNLVEVIREFNPECRILSVGSSEEYGN